jgi:hypothetical protein
LVRGNESPTYDGGRDLEQPGEALELIGAVVDKALALGRAAEAERVLAHRLRALLAAAEADPKAELRGTEDAARYAVKLAAATGKGSWIDYIFELYRCLKRPLPGDVVDDLYQVLRRVHDVSVDVLREYVATLRAHQSAFGPNERFLVQRIEGLERLAAVL